jgi:hypothetical protein
MSTAGELIEHLLCLPCIPSKRAKVLQSACDMRVTAWRSFPPGKHLRFGAAGRPFLHMYQAHIAAYEAIKAADGVL